MSEVKKTSEEVEQEQLTRRAALRKFGFGAGMAALMALSVDDFARMAARKLEQHAGDNKVANAVAKEFRNAGVAFASGPSCSPYCTPDILHTCEPCYGGYILTRIACPNSNCALCADFYMPGCYDNEYPGYSNPLECCQYECEKCCQPEEPGGLSPCGNTPNLVQGTIAACQQRCEQIFGGGI